MHELIRIRAKTEIPLEFQGTPIGLLLEYNNLSRSTEDVYSNAQILIGMCMDNRKHLHTPDNFAYILRAGGANLRYSEFKLSYAIAVGGIRHMALIGHTQCGMVNLKSRREVFIQGMMDGAGWERKTAEEHFNQYEPLFEIGNEIQFVLSETKRLRLRYPKIQIAPFIYRIEDNLLYGISERGK